KRHPPAELDEIVDLEQRRVVELGQQATLVAQALDGFVVHVQIGTKQLDRDIARQPPGAGHARAVDLAEAAFAKAVSEREGALPRYFHRGIVTKSRRFRKHTAKLSVAPRSSLPPSSAEAARSRAAGPSRYNGRP